MAPSSKGTQGKKSTMIATANPRQVRQRQPQMPRLAHTHAGVQSRHWFTLHECREQTGSNVVLGGQRQLPEKVSSWFSKFLGQGFPTFRGPTTVWLKGLRAVLIRNMMVTS